MLCPSRCRLGYWALALVAAAGFAWAAVAQEKGAKGPADKSAKPAAEKPDPFAVPNGSPEDLLKYIDGLKNERPASDSREAALEFFKNQGRAP